MAVIRGWDIGGVHLKTAGLSIARDGSASIETRIVPFEIWRDPAGLAGRLRDLAGGQAGAHAVTMTAELSDVFATRAEGVRAILAACGEALRGPIRVLDTSGRLMHPEEALERPLQAAAANWMATASLAARVRSEALLVDMGSTTTDIIPIRRGEPRPAGRSDTERLMTGELLYTGVLRTPPASLAGTVPLSGASCRVSPEHFTNMGDVHLILGTIEESDYTTPTPDGRGRSREEAMRRLARLVCADLDTIGVPAVETIARHLAARQLERVRDGIACVLARAEPPRPKVAVTAGMGAFLAEAAARENCLEPVGLETLFPRLSGPGWARAAPAAALAVLLAEEVGAFRFIS